MTERPRLDSHLVARGDYPTRARARDAIRRGCVAVGGTVVTKPGTPVSPQSPLAIDDPARGYVSRAALKLIAGLDRFGFSPEGRVAMDLGASTGGFCQVLLERGAKTIIAVDVGHDQLAPEIAADPRLHRLDGVNARDLTAAMLPETPGCVTSDLSFISLKQALPPALDLVAAPAWGLFLVKPQFEVGREGIGKGGRVRDPAAGLAAAERIADWLGARPGWRVEGLVPSPIEGGDGNREYLLGARRD